MNKEDIDQLITEMRKQYEDDYFRSHMAINETVSNIGSEVIDIKKKLNSIGKILEEDRENNTKDHNKIFEKLQEIQPVLDFRNGLVSVKSIIVGLSAVMVALGVIGSGFIYLVKSVIH